ncbi:653_t:CDS:1 [Paraglomus brasilianum]|uniref:653_t:CDS:1 n=1 Tax=Paraglomus brasilianum TaxID=144538 RepID=A0A9N9DIP5_9GLOM|nr:653_t:CDS:1 [Paraglomus brasilianum]
MPNAQENPSTKPTNAKITILATSTDAPNNNINNTLAIEILSTITAALSIIAILLGICIRRIRKRKLGYKRNLTQAPIGTSQTPFTTPLDLNNINIEQLAQQLSQLQNNQPPRYK